MFFEGKDVFVFLLFVAVFLLFLKNSLSARCNHHSHRFPYHTHVIRPSFPVKHRPELITLKDIWKHFPIESHSATASHSPFVTNHAAHHLTADSSFEPYLHNPYFYDKHLSKMYRRHIRKMLRHIRRKTRRSKRRRKQRYPIHHHHHHHYYEVKHPYEVVGRREDDQLLKSASQTLPETSLMADKDLEPKATVVYRYFMRIEYQDSFNSF